MNNKLPEAPLDFFKFMDATIQSEEAKRSKVLPVEGKPETQKEEYNPNREYMKRYSHRISDRMWIGPRRY